MSTVPIDEKAVFNTARQIGEAGARASYLQAVCRDDPAALQRICDLLHVHEQERSFLESPAAAYSPTLAERPITETPGTVIGLYKLLEQIGEGGFGVVFMAEQTAPVKRKVALKVIKPGMDTKEVIARFEAERQALALMDHPNIARVLDAGATDTGRPFFVMELVRGVPITDYCDQHQLTPKQRLDLFVTVCQAVQHAHQKGIIHRDIKPSNVLVTLHDDKPVVKVIDFGIAKATSGQLTDKTLFTGFAQLVGTPLYMSPEQAALSGLDVDTRSDIYSLGVLLYELLTGTTPFDKTRLQAAAFDEVRRIIREEEPQKPSTRLSSLGGTLPSVSAVRKTEPRRLSQLMRGDLDWIVMKALEKDRARRYETANGFAADVLHYLADEPVTACPPSTRYRFRKFARRNRAAFVIGSVVFAALLLVTIGLAVSNVLVRAERNEKIQALGEREQALKEKQSALQQAQDNYALAQSSAEDARLQKRLAQQQEKLAQRRFYAAQMNLAMQAWEKGDLVRVLDLLESQRPGPGKEDLRAFDWHYLWRLCHSGRRLVLQGQSGIVTSLAFSPNGNTLAAGGGDGTVNLWDLAAGQTTRTLKADAGVNAVVFSPDGEVVAAGCSDGLIRLWDIETGELRTTFRGHQDIVWSVAFTADGKTLVSGSQDRTVMLWDVPMGTRQATLEGHGLPVTHVAISPDGKTVASCAWPQVPVKVWDVASRRERFELPGPKNVAFTDDGTLATSGWLGVRLWDAATGTERGRTPPSNEMGEAERSAISADGKTVFFVSTSNTVWLWDIPRGELHARLGCRSQFPAIASSPDGGALAVAAGDGSIEIWDRSPAEEAITLTHDGGAVTFAFSPDHKTLVSAGASGAKFWDLATGRALAEVASSPAQPDPDNPYSTKHPYTSLAGELALSPDGALLAIPDDKAVKLIDAVTHQEVGTLVGHDQPVYLIAFGGDGRFLATLALDGAKCWDLATRQVTTVIPQCQSMCLAYSPDGQTLITGGRSRLIELWDAVTGQRKAELMLPGEDDWWIRAATFSPDGKTLAVGGINGQISLWDMESNSLRSVLHGETQIIATLAFSPDGKTLASGTKRTVKLWEVETGQERITLKRGASLLAFSPDGNTLGVGVRGQVLLLLTDPAALGEAGRLAPTPLQTHEAQGWTLLTQGQFADAEAEFRAAIRLQPDLISGLRGLSEALRDQKKLAEAEAALRDAIALDPQQPWMYEAVARLLLDQQKPADAIAALREAIWLDPSRRGLRETLAWTCFRLKQFRDAEFEFREAVRLAPDGAGGHFGLARTLQEQNKLDEAVAQFHEALRLDPDLFHAHKMLGWALLRQQNFSDAEAAFREVIRLMPEEAVGYTGLGRALVEQRKFVEAESFARESLRLESTNPLARVILNRALAGQGKPAETESRLNENTDDKRPEPKTKEQPE